VFYLFQVLLVLVENALEVFGLLSTPDVWYALWFLSVEQSFYVEGVMVVGGW
jgi:hypothetical protein